MYQHGVVTRDTDGVQIAPVDNINCAKYQDYLAWVAAGNTPNIKSDESSRCDDWILTKLAFRNRMTPEEKIKMDLMSVDNPQAPTEIRTMSAILRVIGEDLDQAEYIDLNSASVKQGVNTLVSFQILTQNRATEILSTPVTQIEKPRLQLN